MPGTYDQKTFHLDGCMDMDLSFADKTMRTTVYIKMDAHDQLIRRHLQTARNCVIPPLSMHRKGHEENNSKGPNNPGQFRSVTLATIPEGACLGEAEEAEVFLISELGLDLADSEEDHLCNRFLEKGEAT